MVRAFKSRYREALSIFSCKINRPALQCIEVENLPLPIASLVAGQGFVTLMGLVSMKFPLPGAAERALSCPGSLQLCRTLVVHGQPAVGSLGRDTARSLIRVQSPAQKHLGNPQVAEFC